MAATDELDAQMATLMASFKAQAHAMFAHLTPADATPRLRGAVESLVGAVLMLQKTQELGIDRREVLADTLKTLAEVCEKFPERLAAIETRLSTLERRS
jgi:hypothetical protein